MAHIHLRVEGVFVDLEKVLADDEVIVLCSLYLEDGGIKEEEIVETEFERGVGLRLVE